MKVFVFFAFGLVYGLSTSLLLLLVAYLNGWGFEGVGTVCGLLGGSIGAIMSIIFHGIGDGI